MDLNSRYQHNQPNSGLLRFRSNFKQPKAAAANDEPDSLLLRFTNTANTSSTFPEFFPHNKGHNDPSSLSLLHTNSHQGYTTSSASHFSNFISFRNGILLFLFLLFIQLFQCFFRMSLHFLKIGFEMVNILC